MPFTDYRILFLRIKLLYNDVNDTGAVLKLRQMFLMKQTQEDRFPGKINREGIMSRKAVIP